MLNGRGGRDISSTSMSAPRRPGCSDARSYLHVVGPQCHRFATSRVVLPPTLLSAFSLRCSVGAFSCRSAGWCTRTNIAQTCSYISCLISNNIDPVIIHSCNNAAVRRLGFNGVFTSKSPRYPSVMTSYSYQVPTISIYG